MSVSIRHLLLGAAGAGLLTLSLCSARVVLAETQEWLAPPEESAKTNPFPSDKASAEAGHTVYVKRCAGCHGDAGNGDGPDAADLGIHPAKLSRLDPNKESDGALFWKIATGKKPMPRYGTKLTPDQIWQAIIYLRTFHTQ